MFRAPIAVLSPDSRAVFDRAARAFASEFGPARWAARAPGRVNLIGEHIDYNDGFVLPLAIDRACVAVGAPAAGPQRCRIFAVETGAHATFDSSLLVSPREVIRRHVAPGSWTSYIVGVLAVFAQEVGTDRIPAMDLAVATSVPLGGGLSSSASLEVAVATLIESVIGTTIDPVRKARWCQRAEHEFAGVPCGIMDQFASVRGRRDHALCIDCRDESAETIPLPAKDKAVLLVIDSRVRHELAAGEYATRRATCASALAHLGLKSWRDAAPSPNAGLDTAFAALSDDESRCARHVTTEIARTGRAAEILRHPPADLHALGTLMNASHDSLRDDYRVSCPELDAIVEIARATPGVFGARMTGAGFGGCVIALVEPGSVTALTQSLEREYPARTGRTCNAFVTTAADGAHPILLP